MTSLAEKYSQWLTQSRSKREIEYQLNKGITRLQSQFMYQRVKGLNHLLQFLKTLWSSEEKNLFLSVQAEAEASVMKHVFQSVLFPSKQNKATRTPKEQQLGVELIAGILIIYPECKNEFVSLDGIALMLQFLSVEGDEGLQVSVLHLLLAVLADSEAYQQAFEHAEGYEKVEHVVKQKKASKELRVKCVEFLLFCIKFFHADARLVRLFGDYRVKQLHKILALRREEQYREGLYSFIDGMDGNANSN